MNLISLMPFFVLSASASTETAFDKSYIQMFFESSPMIKLVLILLIVFSTISWAIILVKWRYFQKARNETAYFLDLFWESPELPAIQKESNDLNFSPVVQLFSTGYAEFKRASKMYDIRVQTAADKNSNGIYDSVERALERTKIDQTTRMEKALSFLATAGNTAPLMGLFGTVWGIMSAFRGIGLKGSASLTVVAPGISEALTTTALGLIVAIPAVVAYNYFNSRVYELRSEMDTFAADFLSLVVRHSFKKGVNTEKNNVRKQQ